MPRKVAQSLRGERRRAALRQVDISALLGVRGHWVTSDYERGRYLPSLKTALAYEVIFGKPVAELFRPVLDDIRAKVARRAAARLDASRAPQTPGQLRRHAALKRIVGT